MVQKQDIIDGVAKYAEEDIIPKIEEKGFSIGLSFFVSRLKSKKSIADIFFDNPIVQKILPEKDGLYEIEDLLSSLETAIKENGDELILKIPAIPIISPTEKELKFNSKDIRKILSNITKNNEESAK